MGFEYPDNNLDVREAEKLTNASENQSLQKYPVKQEVKIRGISE